MKNYYEILGIPFNADLQMIKTAYKKLSSFSHPDAVPPEHRQWAEERQRELNEAYRVLSDPELRKNYDHSFFTQSQNNFQNDSERTTKEKFKNNIPEYQKSNNNAVTPKEVDDGLACCGCLIFLIIILIALNS